MCHICLSSPFLKSCQRPAGGRLQGASGVMNRVVRGDWGPVGRVSRHRIDFLRIYFLCAAAAAAAGRALWQPRRRDFSQAVRHV